MQYYFAPMEGITDAIFRQTHHKYFPGVHRYYMPFFSPTIHRRLTEKEARELPPADSLPFCAIPQVLTKNAEDFLWAAQVCQDLGYRQLNLNAGCPSGTVTAKGKGSGMLADFHVLDAFLEEVCSRSPLPVSVKTRLGMYHGEDFPELLALYNQYPLAELTIHPRIGKQMYRGCVDMEAFDYAVANSKISLCYNGDLLTQEDLQAIVEKYPSLPAVMLGRGLLQEPGLLSGGTDRETLKAFMEELLEEYIRCFGSTHNAMHRMKENWGYLHKRFPDCDKLWKQMRKSTNLDEFRALSAQMLAL